MIRHNFLDGRRVILSNVRIRIKLDLINFCQLISISLLVIFHNNWVHNDRYDILDDMQVILINAFQCCLISQYSAPLQLYLIILQITFLYELWDVDILGIYMYPVFSIYFKYMHSSYLCQFTLIVGYMLNMNCMEYPQWSHEFPTCVDVIFVYNLHTTPHHTPHTTHHTPHHKCSSSRLVLTRPRRCIVFSVLCSTTNPPSHPNWLGASHHTL